MRTELDELAERAAGAVSSRTPSMEWVIRRARERRRRRLRIAGTALMPVLVLVVVGSWMTMRQGEAPVDVGGDPGDALAPIEDVPSAEGDFVWPFPAREFADIDALVDAFAAEVLRWPSEDIRRDGGDNDATGPEWVYLEHPQLGRQIDLLAVPSPGGWGFVQVGQPPILAANGSGEFELHVTPIEGTVTSEASFHLVDGTVLVTSTTETTVSIPDEIGAEQSASVLILFSDGEGNVIGVVGAHLPAASTAPTPTTPAANADLAVPSVLALSLGEARATLSEVGLEGLLLVDRNFDPDSWLVATQEPAPGTIVRAGTAVVLGLSPRSDLVGPLGGEQGMVADPVCAHISEEPIDEATASAATAAFIGWLDTRPRVDAAPFIDGWAEIGDSVLAAADDAPLRLEDYSGSVDEVLSTSDDLVCVEYSILNGGSPVYIARGAAVLRDGAWKVSRPTVCAAIEVGSVRCPDNNGPGTDSELEEAEFVETVNCDEPTNEIAAQRSRIQEALRQSGIGGFGVHLRPVTCTLSIWISGSAPPIAVVSAFLAPDDQNVPIGRLPAELTTLVPPAGE